MVECRICGCWVNPDDTHECPHCRLDEICSSCIDNHSLACGTPSLLEDCKGTEDCIRRSCIGCDISGHCEVQSKRGTQYIPGDNNDCIGDCNCCSVEDDCTYNDEEDNQRRKDNPSGLCQD